MPAQLDFFPEIVQELNLEVQKHPALLEILSQPGAASSMNEVIAIVAAYCGMILDGYYDEHQLEIIFHDMIKELRKRSTIYIH